jgi:hypothetical protein
MPISQTSILSEIERGRPISARTRAYYRRRLQNRFHRLVSQAFKKQQRATNLTQKELAARIGSDKAQLNRWLGIPGNWTLNTISDLLLGMAVDLDDPSVTPIKDLIENGHPKQTEAVQKLDAAPAPTWYEDRPKPQTPHPEASTYFPMANRGGLGASP